MRRLTIQHWILALVSIAASAVNADSLETAVVAAADRHVLRGVVLVGDRDGTLVARALGSAREGVQPNDLLKAEWRWASVTKQVTALLVMQEVAAQRMTLDAPVAALLPEFRGVTASAITVGDLMRHVSGLPNPDDSALNADGVPSFYAMPRNAARRVALDFCAGAPKAKPRERFEYNNCDYLVLQALLERHTRQTYARLIERRIAGPLGLTSLRVARAQEGKGRGAVNGYRGREPEAPFTLATYGAGGALLGTAQDLLRLDRALLTNELLAGEATAVMWTGDPAIGYAALGAWSFQAPLQGCLEPVALIERRGAIGGVQVRNLLAPQLGRALVVFVDDAMLEFGELWQGAGLGFDLASAAFCTR